MSPYQIQRSIGMLIFVFFAIAGYSQAPQFAVVRPDGTTFICPSLDSAYNKAQDGDKVFLPAGAFAGIVLKKKIKLVGVGINPDSALTSGVTQINSIKLGDNSSYSTIENLIITLPVDFDNSPQMNQIILSSIKFKNVDLVGGIIINYDNSVTVNKANTFSVINCFIGNNSLRVSILGTMNNSLISNSIISGHIISDGINNTIANNLFLFYERWVYAELQLPSTSRIINNIFWQDHNAASSNSTILNNHGYVHGINNVQTGPFREDFSELFINPGIFFHSSIYLFDRKNSYRIKNTSQGKNYGTDGTDIGIYGGLFPWDDSGQYNTPVIYHKKVGSTSTIDGKLKVEYKVRAGN